MSRARDDRDEEMMKLKDQLRELQLKQEEMIEGAKQEAIRDFTANRVGGATLGLNPQTSQQNVN